MTLGIVCCRENLSRNIKEKCLLGFFLNYGKGVFAVTVHCLLLRRRRHYFLGKGLWLPICNQNLPVVTIMAFAFIPVSGFIQRRGDGRELEEENFDAEVKLENACKMGSKERW